MPEKFRDSGAGPYMHLQFMRTFPNDSKHHKAALHAVRDITLPPAELIKETLDSLFTSAAVGISIYVKFNHALNLTNQFLQSAWQEKHDSVPLDAKFPILQLEEDVSFDNVQKAFQRRRENASGALAEDRMDMFDQAVRIGRVQGIALFLLPIQDNSRPVVDSQHADNSLRLFEFDVLPDYAFKYTDSFGVINALLPTRWSDVWVQIRYHEDKTIAAMNILTNLPEDQLPHQEKARR